MSIKFTLNQITRLLKKYERQARAEPRGRRKKGKASRSAAKPTRARRPKTRKTRKSSRRFGDATRRLMAKSAARRWALTRYKKGNASKTDLRLLKAAGLIGGGGRAGARSAAKAKKARKRKLKKVGTLRAATRRIVRKTARKARKAARVGGREGATIDQARSVPLSEALRNLPHQQQEATPAEAAEPMHVPESNGEASNDRLPLI